MSTRDIRGRWIKNRVLPTEIETKRIERLRAALRGISPTQREEASKKRSIAMTGRKLSDEHRQKVLISLEKAKESFPEALPDEIQCQLEKQLDLLRISPIRNRYNTRWLPEEDNLLKEFYPRIRSDILAVFLDRSSDSVQIRASRHLGLKKNPEFWKRWQRAHYQKMVIARNDRLWTQAETEQLKDLFPSKGNNELEKMFNRTLFSITNKAKEQGLKKIHGAVAEGRRGEKLAADFFEKKGWTILNKGNNSSVQDYLVKTNYGTLAINVKYGKTFNESFSNLQSLLTAFKGVGGALLYITPDERIFLLKVEEMLEDVKSIAHT